MIVVDGVEDVAPLGPPGPILSVVWVQRGATPVVDVETFSPSPSDSDLTTSTCRASTQSQATPVVRR